MLKNFKVGDKILITTSAWFFAPDGVNYRGVWGTFEGISDDSVLGVKTNRNSTNWYLRVGNVVIAGCQIHYAVLHSAEPPAMVQDHTNKDGATVYFSRPSHIYICPESGNG